MGLYLNALYFAIAIYAILEQRQLLIYFFAFIGFYSFIYLLTPTGKWNGVRRKIMISTWDEPKEGNIYQKIEIDCTKLQEYVESISVDQRPSITHVVIKACAEILDKSRTGLNGKFIFDKFVPYETVDVTCLIDIGGGQDLAAVTIQKVDQMTIKEIREYIRDKAINIKKNQGDKDHKDRVKLIHYLPPFIVRILMNVSNFLAYNLGLNIPALGLKKNQFGACTVTSLGMLGIKDAFVPFTPFFCNSFILAVGEIQKKAVVKDDKIVIAPILNLNFTIDHRYVDGGSAKKLLQQITDVFENPSKF